MKQFRSFGPKFFSVTLLASIMAFPASAAQISADQCWIVESAFQNSVETIEKWEEGDKEWIKCR